MTFGSRHCTFVDESRSIKASSNFHGASTRRLDVTIWYPSGVTLDQQRTWPLILYSHGTWDHAESATYITQGLALHGYVVIAPNYPLTSCTSFTGIERPDVSDVADQIKDVTYLIDRMLADDFFAASIAAGKIGIMGHSLGAVTSYFATFGTPTRDRRIAATALTGAGDPLRAAANPNLNLATLLDAAASVPTLFLAGEHDLFARMTGDPYAAYERIAGPKYQAMIKGGVHSWFHDSDAPPADGKNPDCLFFENLQPAMEVPGCDERVPLIGRQRQGEITLSAVRSFFDAYLTDNAAALEQLRRFDQQFRDVDLRYDIQPAT